MRLFGLGLVFCLLLTTAGCSGSNSSDTLPDSTQNPAVSVQEQSPVPAANNDAPADSIASVANSSPRNSCEALYDQARAALENEFGVSDINRLADEVRRLLAPEELASLEQAANYVWPEGYDPFMDLGNPLHTVFQRIGAGLFERINYQVLNQTYRLVHRSTGVGYAMDDSIGFRRSTERMAEAIGFFRPSLMVGRTVNRNQIQYLNPSSFRANLDRVAFVTKYRFDTHQSSSELLFFYPDGDQPPQAEPVSPEQYIVFQLPENCLAEHSETLLGY